MNSNKANAYTQTDILTTDPYKLILMLYDGAIRHLFLARQAIQDGDPAARGEHLGKVIGIVTELLSSVEGGPENEAATFLRGLYSAILAELPGVNVTGDVEPVNLSIKYLAQLRNIWKEKVMAQGNITGEGDRKELVQLAKEVKEANVITSSQRGIKGTAVYPSGGYASRRNISCTT